MKKAKNKIGLRGRDVSKTHFSSGVVDPSQTNFSRIVIRILEGRSLLAADFDTGKSDSICFIWFGSVLSDAPSLEDLELNESVKRTKVYPCTTDPLWNQDITIPLGNLVNDIKALANMRILIFVRDEDRKILADGNEGIDYDELGFVELFVKNIIVEGNQLKSSIVQVASWYTLKKSPGMRRVDGKIKLAASLIFVDSDLSSLACQILPEDVDSDAHDTTAPSTMSALLKQLQSYHKSKKVRSSQGISSDGTSSPASVRRSGSRHQSLDTSSVITSETASKLPHRTKSASPARRKISKKKLVTGISGNSLNILMEDPILESSDDAASEYYTDAYQTDADESRSDRRRPKSAPPQVFSAARRYGSTNNDTENYSIHSEFIDNFDLHHDDTSDGEHLHGNRVNDPRNFKYPNSGTEESDSESYFGSKYEKSFKPKHEEEEEDAAGNFVVAKKQVVDRVGGRRRESGEYNKYDLPSDYARQRSVPPTSHKPLDERRPERDFGIEQENLEIDRGGENSNNSLHDGKVSNARKLDEEEVLAQDRYQPITHTIMAEAAEAGATERNELDGLYPEGRTLGTLKMPFNDPGDEFLPPHGPGDEFLPPDGPGDQFIPMDSPENKLPAPEQLKEKLPPSDGRFLEKDTLKTADFNEKKINSFRDEVPKIDSSDIKSRVDAQPPNVNSSDDDHKRPEITGTNRSRNSGIDRIPSTNTNSDRGLDLNKDNQQQKGNSNLSALAIGKDIRDGDADRRNKTEKLQPRSSNPSTGITTDSKNNNENYQRSKNNGNGNISTSSRSEVGGNDDGKVAPNNTSANNNVPGQGSGAAVARALRDIATQKKLMQEHLVELEKITRTGLSALSGRLSNVESMIRESANSKEFVRPRAVDNTRMNNDADQYPSEYLDDSNAEDVDVFKETKAAEDQNKRARKAAHDFRGKNASEAVSKAQQVVEMLDNLPWPPKKPPPRKGDTTMLPIARNSRLPIDSKSSVSKFKTTPVPTMRTSSNSSNSGNSSSRKNLNGKVQSDNVSSVIKAKNDQTVKEKKLVEQEESMDAYNELLEMPEADNAPPPIAERKKKTKSSFREFLEKGSLQKGSNSSEPDISFVYRAPDGTVATAIHAISEEVIIPEVNTEVASRVESQATLVTSTRLPSPLPNQSGPSAGVLTTHIARAPRGDLNERFRYVLDNGSLSDIAALMEVTGPLPEALSVGVRNRVYESIATLLAQPPLALSLPENNSSNLSTIDKHIERCLVWVLALVRSRDGNLLNELVPHTKRDLVDALERPAKEPSKRGLLAALLKSQLQKFVTQ